MPSAIKDKKKLRERLEERGFSREKIDWYLSRSSLADSGNRKDSDNRDTMAIFGYRELE